jgi:precorrin-6B methylase 2
LQLCIDNDFLTIDLETRSGLPDESRPTLVLINGTGEQHTVAKWARQKVGRFDRIYVALLNLEKRAESIPPSYEGPFDRHWTPDKAALKG